jgi:hypothetical protein
MHVRIWPLAKAGGYPDVGIDESSFRMRVIGVVIFTGKD